MPLLLIPHIHRTTHQIGLYIERAGLGVSQGEAHILAHLAAAGDCSIGDLHKAFAHKRSTLTSVLDRLAERGLIRREVHARDRRSFLVSLTPSGKKLANQVYRRLEALEKIALREMGDSKAPVFRSMIGSVEKAATGA